MAPKQSSYSSPALRALRERFGDGHEFEVFDLGPSSGSNIEFYSTFARFIYVEDLYGTVDEERARGRITVEKLRGRMTSVPQSAKLDLICFWDIINYLTPEENAVVAEFLAPFCHENTAILVLMHSRGEMPAAPVTFRIKENNQVVWDSVPGAVTSAPIYSKRHIERMYPFFKRERSVLLQCAMEEHLYSAARVEKQDSVESQSRPEMEATQSSIELRRL